MKAVTYLLRLILAGLLIGFGTSAVAQISSPPVTDASRLTTGELDDGRLSANVPLLNQANTFTVSPLFLSNTQPRLCIAETDADQELRINVSGGTVAMRMGTAGQCSIAGGESILQALGGDDSELNLGLTFDTVTAEGHRIVTDGRSGWARVDDAGTLVDSGGFVSSASRTGEGTYSVGFTRPGAAEIDFACTVSLFQGSGGFATIGGIGSTQVDIRTSNTSDVATDSDFMVVCLAE